ncbi:MAG: flavodoxin [Alistipes shahii]
MAYFPHSGNTRAVAETDRCGHGCRSLRNRPAEALPREYRAVVDQARREIGADYRPALKTDLPDAGRYDVIYIGSPCWWSTVAPPVATFLASHDFTGETSSPS